jgi:hypothetical protein
MLFEQMEHPHSLIGGKSKNKSNDEGQAKEQFSHFPLFNVFLFMRIKIRKKRKNCSDAGFLLYICTCSVRRQDDSHTTAPNVPLHDCKPVAFTMKYSIP